MRLRPPTAKSDAQQRSKDAKACCNDGHRALSPGDLLGQHHGVGLDTPLKFVLAKDRDDLIRSHASVLFRQLPIGQLGQLV